MPFLKHISILRHSHISKSGLKTWIWKTLTCFQEEQPDLPHTVNNTVCVCVYTHRHTQHIGYTWQKLLRHFMKLDPPHQSLIFLQQSQANLADALTHFPQELQLCIPASPAEVCVGTDTKRATELIPNLCWQPWSTWILLRLGGSPAPAGASPSGAFLVNEVFTVSGKTFAHSKL